MIHLQALQKSAREMTSHCATNGERKTAQTQEEEENTTLKRIWGPDNQWHLACSHRVTKTAQALLTPTHSSLTLTHPLLWPRCEDINSWGHHVDSCNVYRGDASTSQPKHTWKVTKVGPCPHDEDTGSGVQLNGEDSHRPPMSNTLYCTHSFQFQPDIYFSIFFVHSRQKVTNRLFVQYPSKHFVPVRLSSVLSPVGRSVGQSSKAGKQDVWGLAISDR